MGSQTADKAIRLVDYLQELSRLQTRSIKSLDTYHKLLWMSDIPLDSKYCYLRNYSQKEDFDGDIWLEVKKYDEPILDDVPEPCEEWVDNSKLHNVEVEPELKESIEIQEKKENPDWQPGDPEEQKEIVTTKILRLENYPDVVSKWKSYVEEKWRGWAALHKKWEAVKDVYTKLFSIHQDQLKLGEEYELVFSLGLLAWTSDKGYSVKRHMMVASANLNFEARLGRFTIGPSNDGAKLRFEFDMLDVQDQPPYRTRKSAEEMLAAANDDPWDNSTVEPALQSLTNIISKGDGEYSKGLDQVTPDNKSKPHISFAPALILRKRNAKSLQDVLQNIKEQIEQGIKIPKEFLDLSEAGESREVESDGVDYIDPGEINSQSFADNDSTIYFPLPSNEKQNEIVKKYNQSSGVLVQGPPGTGKSHTIANLICHLLATGQRVLVTSKTPRALKVLKDKLPESTRPLCINLLGSGIEEQTNLETSVVNILSKQDEWNSDRSRKQIAEEEDALDKAKREKAESDQKIRSIRESESYIHSIVDGKYSGTAAKIAQRIAAEEKMYGWFGDEIRHDEANEFSVSFLQKLKSKLCLYDEEKKKELRKKLPQERVHYPSADEFARLVNEESKLKSILAEREALLSSEKGRVVGQCTDLHAIQNIITQLQKLKSAIENIRRRPLQWIDAAIYDMLSDKDTPWKDLKRILGKQLDGLKDRSLKFETRKIDFGNISDKNKLLADAKLLLGHYEQGGKKGWKYFAPKVVKDTRYISSEVKVDGRLCDSVELLKDLIEFLEVQNCVTYAWSLWSGKADRVGGPLFLQVGELEELQEALGKVVDLYDVLESSKEVLQKVPGLGEIEWHDEKQIMGFLEILQVYASTFDFESLQKSINEYLHNLKVFNSNELNAHPITNDLVGSIQSRDLDSYLKHIATIDSTRTESEAFQSMSTNFKKVSEIVPQFAKMLIDSSNEIDDHILQFEKAWDWRRAKSWMDEHLKEDTLPNLERNSRSLEKKIRTCTETLASLKAWTFCFARMTDSHRRHLMGWQQAIKKIGKGTGKHAPKYRRTAQSHLSECRDAVPAWVMPLHRVYETVNPKPGTFDVVIVDEASQCGPDALPLTYLTKKIIVVGDDQQISPEAIGIQPDKVHALMEEYLHDFSHADSFSPDTSLFDQAKRRFPNRIVLQEHFRCMPEIIRFSNDLCYSSTPLIPLRQYPPQRLLPL